MENKWPKHTAPQSLLPQLHLQPHDASLCATTRTDANAIPPIARSPATTSVTIFAPLPTATLTSIYGGAGNHLASFFQVQPGVSHFSSQTCKE